MVLELRGKIRHIMLHCRCICTTFFLRFIKNRLQLFRLYVTYVSIFNMVFESSRRDEAYALFRGAFKVVPTGYVLSLPCVLARRKDGRILTKSRFCFVLSPISTNFAVAKLLA